MTRQEALLTTGLRQGPALKHSPKCKGERFLASPSPLKRGHAVHTVTRLRYFYPCADTTATFVIPGLITHQTWQAISQNNSKNEIKIFKKSKNKNNNNKSWKHLPNYWFSKVLILIHSYLIIMDCEIRQWNRRFLIISCDTFNTHLFTWYTCGSLQFISSHTSFIGSVLIHKLPSTHNRNKIITTDQWHWCSPGSSPKEILEIYSMKNGSIKKKNNFYKYYPDFYKEELEKKLWQIKCFGRTEHYPGQRF